MLMTVMTSSQLVYRRLSVTPSLASHVPINFPLFILRCFL